MCVAGMQPVLGPDVQDRCGSTFCIAVASLLFLFTLPAYLGVLSILGQREKKRLLFRCILTIVAASGEFYSVI